MSDAVGVTVRPETPGDHAAIRDVNRRAFGTDLEAGLVDALRDEALSPWISQVAVRGDVVGHILFTPVSVEGASGTSTALALGPMAVAPERQRQGIGSALVRAGLDACRDAGHARVFVLGHPEYYPRIGFRPAPPLGFRCTWDVPPEVFMVLDLAPAPADVPALVRYHPQFDRV